MRGLDAFARWFGSAWGVVETFVVVAGIVALEYLDPHLDPHWFWLLVWLTVYSAITQPALAFGNEKASRQLEEQQRRIEDLVRQVEATEERILEAIEPSVQR